jgi:hypothetical protein
MKPLYKRVGRCAHISVLPLMSYAQKLNSFKVFWKARNTEAYLSRTKYVKVMAPRRSQWSRGVMHELSSLARTLASWVWIPFKAWMSVCVRLFCVCVVLCVGRGLTTGLYGLIIYVPSQQLQDQVETHHSVDTSNYIMEKHNIKSKTNYRQALEETHINTEK